MAHSLALPGIELANKWQSKKLLFSLVFITKTLVDLLLNLIIDDIIKGNINSF